MYRLRDMRMDDKVCEQVSMTMLSQVYPREVIERCVQSSKPWCDKVRRVRLSTALALVLFVIALALWSRRNQRQVWASLVGKLSDLHPAQPDSAISDSGLSGRQPVPTGVVAGTLPAAGDALKHAQRLLWSLSADGH